MLFVGAAWATVLYVICRRFLTPSGAALVACVALVWSFPNYFAGLPCWWLLVTALSCLWLFIRYGETAQPGYLLIAGLCTGIAVIVKQTGLYLVIAMVMATAFTEASTATRLSRWLPRGVAVVAVLFVAVLLKERLFQTEGVFLGVPVVACAVALWRQGGREEEGVPGRSARALLVLLAGAAVPVLGFLVQYAHPDHFMTWLDGTFVQPKLRLGFATERMPAALEAIGYAAPLLAFATVGKVPWSRVALGALWLMAVVLPLRALNDFWAYQAIWQSARVSAVLLPVVVAWRLRDLRRSGDEDTRRRDATLFAAAVSLALFSLNQHPFAGSIYFLYTAPLVLVCGIRRRAQAQLHRRALARALGRDAGALRCAADERRPHRLSRVHARTGGALRAAGPSAGALAGCPGGCRPLSTSGRTRRR